MDEIPPLEPLPLPLAHSDFEFGPHLAKIAESLGVPPRIFNPPTEQTRSVLHSHFMRQVLEQHRERNEQVMRQIMTEAFAKYLSPEDGHTEEIVGE